MAILEIVQFPHPALKNQTQPVEGINQAIKKLIRDMTETMYHAPGSGLAANQVGVPKQILIADATKKDEEKNTVVIVNPQIIEISGETENLEEGCLSVPDFSAEVERAVRITLAGKNLKGEDIEVEAEGFMARVLQHEIDHLNGVLYIDRIGRLKRQSYVRQRKKVLAAQNK